MKKFECGTLVPGCDWSTEAKDEAEVIRRAVEHLKSAHEEETIHESTLEAIRQRVKDA